MNFLRQSVRCARPLQYSLRRSYSAGRQFVPPAQLSDVENPVKSPEGGWRDWRDEEVVVKPPPESASFYTARPVYYDQVIMLEKAIGQVQGALKALGLLPLPAFARASLPPPHAVWKTQEEMTNDFQTKLTRTRYRKVTTLLNKLNELFRIAHAAQATNLTTAMEDIISMFESGKKEALLTRGKRKKVVLDHLGRSYTVGRRKTSSARVWMIPVHSSPEQTPEKLFGIPESEKSIPVTTTTILVNGLPLNEYFPLPADRERITRPLKVAGVLGAYNVFALTRGGGTTGQSGALSHGISKGIVAHEPELETMFRRAKLTRRDPRMVERKKTGLAKARKAYAWVRR